MAEQDRTGAGPRHGGGERSPVRPYAVTGGRTARTALPPETVVVAAEQRPPPGGEPETHPPEAARIVALCRPWCSVAEISALLHLQLGVVRVLVEDLADAGRVYLHPPSPASEDTDQLERALRELRKRI